MATDVCLFTKRATKGTGASAVPGVCMITKSKVKWEPSDPSRAQPVVLDINASAAQATAQAIRAQGSEALCVVADVSQAAQVDAAVATALQHFGRIDVLFNHAGSIVVQPFLDTTEAHFQQQFATGLFSTVHFMQGCYPWLKANKGKVINFASGAGVLGAFGFTPYAAAKEAIRGVSRVAAREWAADRINVNIICPTSMTDALKESIADPAILEIVSRTPLGIPGDPLSEVAPVALFLATDAANYITGHSFHVDGGNLMDAGR